MAAAALVAVLVALAAGCGDDATSAATCAPESFLGILQATYDDEAAGLRVAAARVERCANGYAQVFAVPDDSACEPGVGGCFETEQVFFREVDDVWEILTSGTGIGCDDLDGSPELRAACDALDGAGSTP